jgi:hypothetical protein
MVPVSARSSPVSSVYLGEPFGEDDLLACVRSALAHALSWQEVKHGNEWQFRAVRR